MTDNLDVALDRPLPQSIDAERAVLGAVLIDNAAYWRIANMLDGADFFKDAHRAIYGVVKQLAGEGRGFDLLTVKDSLGDRLADVGGSAYVSSLLDVIPDMTHVEGYAELVVRDSKLRRLIVTGNAMMHAALERECEPDEIAADALANLSGVATRADAQARPLATVIREAYEELELQRVGETSDRLVTGYKTLDYHRAIRRTLIIAGSPSQHGKTAFAVNLAEGLASNGHPVAMFSLESTERETALRYVSAIGGISHKRVQDWTLLEASDWPKIANAEATAKRRAIYLTRRVRTVEGIYAECRRLKTVRGLDAAFIDYIQLVKMPQGPRDREERMAAISQMLLEAAVDLGIAIIATSQLTEDRKQRESGRLHQSDLKYARAIGETARVVLLFQRPYADDKAGDAPPCSVPFQIEKSNEGTTGDFPMHFDERTQAFREGTCAENNCRRLPVKEQTLFASGERV